MICESQALFFTTDNLNLCCFFNWAEWEVNQWLSSQLQGFLNNSSPSNYESLTHSFSFLSTECHSVMHHPQQNHHQDHMGQVGCFHMGYCLTGPAVLWGSLMWQTLGIPGVHVPDNKWLHTLCCIRVKNGLYGYNIWQYPVSQQWYHFSWRLKL